MSSPTSSELITPDDERRLAELWQSTNDKLSLGSQAALKHFMIGLRDLIGACDCQWYAAQRGLTPCDVFSVKVFDKWWVVDLYKPLHQLSEEEQDKVTKFFLEKIREHGFDHLTQHGARNAGKTRIHLRQDVISDEEWEEYWVLREYLQPIYGVAERMQAVFHVSKDCESYFVLDRTAEQGLFDERARRLAYLAIAGTGMLQRRLFFVRGLLPPSTKVLSPRERETLSLLLRGYNEKEIAEELSLSVHTVHQYTTSIYRAFRVRGRVGLFAVALSC
ncbi:helix-turn-helix transcriptional regulator [Roseibacillus ishigakijimensis]|uniref:Helix-turn-helix transcriptional regulator n=1 Tax=Roseibacillus ishigakijimensis TaxID=454146 RepID=A0A934RVT6_9BACT|nr:helix-turn-helix transcriptional regulator [Roseibacillus ishigakijimensis]MBK1835080.1 helix-turn-helix transcriptional regulator [Roseibacillus ishigakijimensis]